MERNLFAAVIDTLRLNRVALMLQHGTSNDDIVEECEHPPEQRKHSNRNDSLSPSFGAGTRPRSSFDGSLVPNQ